LRSMDRAIDGIERTAALEVRRSGNGEIVVARRR